MKTYNNSKVRAGEKITNPSSHAKGYEKWVFDSIQKQIDKAKSDKGKQKYTNIQKEYVREVKRHTANLVQVITFQNLLVDAKMQIVKKLNSVKGLTDTFIRTPNGYKVTNPEGYVAIDRVSGGAVKLVDRLEFSFNNFTGSKGMGQMKTFSEHSDLQEQEYKRTATITQRRKLARRMRMLSKQAGFKMKKKRTLMRVRDTAKLTKVARKEAIKMFRNKAYPNYNDLSISARVKADQIVMQRFGKRIDKVAKKQARKLRAAEPERVKKFRASQRQLKNEKV